MKKNKKDLHINAPFPHTERDIEIIQLYKTQKLSYRKLAKLFKISHTRVMQILKNYE